MCWLSESGFKWFIQSFLFNSRLRKEAVVVLYDNGYIKSYVARDGSFELMDKVCFL